MNLLSAHLAALLRKIPNFGQKLKASPGKEAFLREIMDLLDHKTLKELSDRASSEDLSGCRILDFFSSGYPEQLRRIASPPLMLFIKGDPGCLNDRCIAVVGARDCTDYGKKTARDISMRLSSNGYCLVSGLARGIDSVVHNTTMECGGLTAAVLAWGMASAGISSSQSALCSRVSGQGVLVTEYPPSFPASKMTFPVRNRIISGLSIATIVVEAREKSGSLITARQAFEQNRDLIVVPGRLGDEMSAGCLSMAYSYKARLLWKISLLDELFPPRKREQTREIPDTGTGLTGPHAVLFNLIRNENGPAGGDQLLRESGLSPGELAGILLELEMDGLIRRLPGNRFEAD